VLWLGEPPSWLWFSIVSPYFIDRLVRSCIPIVGIFRSFF
jgi:hypothetical protein